MKSALRGSLIGIRAGRRVERYIKGSASLPYRIGPKNLQLGDRDATLAANREDLPVPSYYEKRHLTPGVQNLTRAADI